MLAPLSTHQHGRISLVGLAVALLVAALGYGTARYAPIFLTHQDIKEALRAAGARAVAGDEPGARRDFDARMSELSVGWLRAGELYWQPESSHHLDVGARYTVVVDHGLLQHTLRLSWYCTASPHGCAPFRPTFVE